MPFTPGLTSRDREVERLLRERVELAELGRRGADRERAGEVRVTGRVAVAREEVEDDRLAGRDRPGAAVVADRRLRAVRDDELLGSRAVLAERALDLELDPLGGERLAVERQTPPSPFELARRSMSTPTATPASTARHARRMPASSCSFLTRLRASKKCWSAASSIPFARR